MERNETMHAWTKYHSFTKLLTRYDERKKTEILHGVKSVIFVQSATLIAGKSNTYAIVHG